MQEILSYFEQSLDDYLLTRSERKSLKSILAGQSPSKRELDWLRSQLYDLVRKNIPRANTLELINWLEEANKILLREPENEPSTSKVYFSPGENCLNCILEQIAYATQSIDVCVFTISDNRISDKLLYAHSKGIQIRIITDDEKCFDEGSDIKLLSAHDIEVKTDQSPSHMHHKFAIFDNKSLITGSYNWTRSASKYNQENVLLCSDSNAINFYSREFERLWANMSFH